MTALRPWAGWIGGLAGWFTAQQLGGSLVQLDCGDALPIAMAGGALGAAIVLIGAFLAWPIWRTSADLEQPYAGARRFIAGTGELAAALFLLAIIFQTMSSLIIPQCHA